jgi:hypothetical protein
VAVVLVLALVLAVCMVAARDMLTVRGMKEGLKEGLKDTMVVADGIVVVAAAVAVAGKR